jgi:hypothetical protein
MGSACGSGAASHSRAGAAYQNNAEPAGAEQKAEPATGAPKNKKKPRSPQAATEPGGRKLTEPTESGSTAEPLSGVEPDSAPATASESPIREVSWLRGSHRGASSSQSSFTYRFAKKHQSSPNLLTRVRPGADETQEQRDLSIRTIPSKDELVKKVKKDPAAQLFDRVKKASLSYTREIRGSSACLSQEDDLNAATLRRLAPSAKSQKGDLRALVVIDWDDTLFPTTWYCKTGGGEPSEYREIAEAAAGLLRAARKAGDVVIVTLGTEAWVRQCIDSVGDDEFSDELARVRIIYAREIQDFVEVWARQNLSYEDVATNLGTLLTSTAWDPELRAQLVAAKAAAMTSALAGGCQQVVSIGDSEIERWAAHDLPLVACDARSLALVKTIKFEEGLGIEQLTETLLTTGGFLTQFVRLSVAMDVELRSDDEMFALDLQFAMQSAARPEGFAEPPPRPPGALRDGLAARIWHEV